MSNHPDTHHLYPDFDGEPQHNTTGGRCWCEPDEYQLCPICNGEEAGCAYCYTAGSDKPGLVPVYDESLPKLILHNRPGEEG